MKLSRIIEVSLLVGVIGAILFTTNLTRAQSPQFSVWEKVDPCKDSRQDWFTVAQDYPGTVGGLPKWVQRDTFNTFAAAAAAADVAKMGSRFNNIGVCCKDWNVWKNDRTGKFSVTRASQPAPAVEGWHLNNVGLCCEEAAIIAGFDPVGCTIFALVSVPGARVRVTQQGFVSLSGTIITIPTNPPVVVTGISGGGTQTGTASISGTWTNPDGTMVQITQNGSSVTGNFTSASSSGTFSGTFNGTTLVANYTNNSNGSGTITMTLSGDGTTLDGNWSTSGGQSGPLRWMRGGTTGSGGSSTSGVSSGPGQSCWTCVDDEHYCKRECDESLKTHVSGVKVDFGDQCVPINFGDECSRCWEAKCKGTLYPNR